MFLDSGDLVDFSPFTSEVQHHPILELVFFQRLNTNILQTTDFIQKLVEIPRIVRDIFLIIVQDFNKVFYYFGGKN